MIKTAFRRFHYSNIRHFSTTNKLVPYTTILPKDLYSGTLIGRVWVPEFSGPSVVSICEDGVYDLSSNSPFVTVTHLLREQNPTLSVKKTVQELRRIGKKIASVEEVISNSLEIEVHERKHKVHLLAPVDLQAIKAAGVTFVRSLLERVIEEQAKGDPKQADAIRKLLGEQIGTQINNIKPGSPEAKQLKETFQKQGIWSQYLEVGLMEDCEIFTKSQPMSAIGLGHEIGIHPKSIWNNPEPEVVLVVNPRGEIVGASLGNDQNLRDFEGRSALLLGKAKDNNASCSIGPFIRLFDETFTIDHVRNAEIELEIRGQDNFTLVSQSSMNQISRDVTDLVSQALNRNHQYPDGMVLFVGTMFAPTTDRDPVNKRGEGFTHKVGDEVLISNEKLGMLINRVNYSDKIVEWKFGVCDLMENLSKRKLLRS